MFYYIIISLYILKTDIEVDMYNNFDSINKMNELIYKEMQQQSDELWSNTGPLLGGMYASAQLIYLKEIIEEYEKSIAEDSQVAIWLTNFGQAFLMQVTKIYCKDPVLMVFEGYVDGKPSVLTQHINQLNFLLTTTPKNPNIKIDKIGFGE